MILANQCIGRILFIAIKGKQPDFLNMEGEASEKNYRILSRHGI